MSSSENEKKFTMSHSFENVMNMRKGESMDGPIEKHFNIPWKIRISRMNGDLKIYLCCMVPTKNDDWLLKTRISGKVIRKNDRGEYTFFSMNFNEHLKNAFFKIYSWSDVPEMLNDGSFDFEFTVIIEEATGVRLEAQKARVFDDEAARADSDVTLIVGDQKFHVVKNFLATHSTYFKALFFGNLAESGKVEIELKEIDPTDFQHFLDYLYLESSIKGHSVLGILHLADFFDSKTVVERCQEFLVERSNLPLHRKFEAAIKYNLDELKTMCISEINSAADLRQIVPENSKDFDSEIWKELFLKALSMIQK